MSTTNQIFSSPAIARSCSCERPVTYRDEGELRCTCGRAVVDAVELNRLRTRELARDALDAFDIEREEET